MMFKQCLCASFENFIKKLVSNFDRTLSEVLRTFSVCWDAILNINYIT